MLTTQEVIAILSRAMRLDVLKESEAAAIIDTVASLRAEIAALRGDADELPFVDDSEEVADEQS